MNLGACPFALDVVIVMLIVMSRGSMALPTSPFKQVYLDDLLLDSKNSSFNVLGYYIFARILIGLAILLWMTLSIERTDSISNLYFYISASLFSVMAAMAFASIQHGQKRWFIWMQYVVDALFLSGVLALGTSFQNPFVVLYAINILASVSLGEADDVLWVTLFDVCCYLIVQSLGYWDFLNWVMPSNTLILYVKVISEVFGLILIGALSWVMALEAEKTYQSLQEQVMRTRRLRRYHIDVLNELPMALFVQDGGEDGQLVPQNALARLWYTDMQPELDWYRSENRGSFSQDGREYRVRKVPLSQTQSLVMVEDVTLIREMEGIIAKEEQLAIMGRMSASLAHEIRNPIASLSGAVQMLAQKEQNRLHTIILREVNRINELVELFLQSARSPNITKEIVVISMSIQEIVMALTHDSRCQKVRFVLSELPEIELLVDSDKFRQVLWNILLNAVQAMPNGGNIFISLEVLPTQIAVLIKDEGKGIAREDISKIFDPFFSKRQGGTGLGLFVVEQIMTAHQGRIDVKSEIGQGTEFRLSFPFEKDMTLQNVLFDETSSEEN